MTSKVHCVCFLVENEEVLKKCAQEYLARVKQEEQRYQTLKLHAEEKLDKYVESKYKTTIRNETLDRFCFC